MPGATPDWLQHSTNLVGVPTGLLASEAFNRHPVPLHINGVREFNAGLFRLLNETESLAEAGFMFLRFTERLFALGEAHEGRREDAARRFRSSYLRLLQGWNFDANGPQGAVLKGWVESRFGLLPTFHREPLRRFGSDAWMRYVEEKMSNRFHNNAINAQLDLLYEFCQWAIARFGVPARRHVTLYRGVNNFDEQRLLSTPEPVAVAPGPPGEPRKRGAARRFPGSGEQARELVVRLNNLSSFSFSRETAEQFGDWILEASVPVVKLLYFNGLLAKVPLRGEGECLVLGGDYRMRAAYW